MSDNFDWKTEDDHDWSEIESVPLDTAVPRKPPWRTLSIIAGLLIVAVLVIYWQYNRRIEALTMTVEVDVLSAHNLLNRAIAQQDLELAAPLLSARDLSWTKAQEQLLENSLTYDRAQLDLPLSSEEANSPNLTAEDDHYLGIEVSPDFNEAILSFTKAYQPDPDDTAVLLAQTAVYRRGRSRWLLSPPSDEFWGSWETIETEHLTLNFPARDSELAAQLAEDLPETLMEACAAFETEPVCEKDFHIHLRLDTDPESLLAATNPTNLYDGNFRLNLPAPTLIGLPVNEAGYEAILQSYAAPIMAVLITEAVGWECCHQAPVYQALLDYELAQLGLRPWPVTLNSYRDVVNAGLNIDAIFPFWIATDFSQLNSDMNWQVYAFVDFLMRENLPLSNLEKMASLSGNQNMQLWLATLYEADIERGFVIQDRLSRDWWLDAQAQMLASQRARPIAFPEQDLLMTCADDNEDNLKTTVYRYSFVDDEWQALQEKNGFLFGTPLPDDNAVVLGGIDFTSELWQTELFENGESTPLFSDAYPFTLSWGQVDATKENMLVFGSPLDEEFRSLLVNIPSCKAGDCEFTPVNGVPFWSPEGTQFILTEMAFMENGLVHSDDGRSALFDTSLYFNNMPLTRSFVNDVPENAKQIGGDAGGDFPFWIDENVYGYVTTTSVQEAAQEVMLASTTDDAPVSVLKTEQLMAAIPEAKRPFRLAIRAVQPHPLEKDLLVVMAVSRLDGFLFVIDLQNNVVENLLQFGTHSNHFMGFSPDGRYLILTGAPEEGFRGPQDVVTFYLHDIPRNQTQTFIAGASSFTASYTFDWSLDGNWLAMSMNNGTINLIAPAYDYQTIIRHEFGDCSSLAWLNAPSE